MIHIPNHIPFCICRSPGVHISMLSRTPSTWRTYVHQSRSAGPTHLLNHLFTHALTPRDAYDAYERPYVSPLYRYKRTNTCTEKHTHENTHAHIHSYITTHTYIIAYMHTHTHTHSCMHTNINIHALRVHTPSSQSHLGPR